MWEDQVEAAVAAAAAVFPAAAVLPAAFPAALAVVGAVVLPAAVHPGDAPQEDPYSTVPGQYSSTARVITARLRRAGHRPEDAVPVAALSWRHW